MKENHKSLLARIIFPKVRIGVSCIIFISLVASTGTINAEKCEDQINYENCLQMTTTAKSGLRMRDSASMRGKEIASIPIDTTVYLDSATDRRMSLSGTEGCWVKVCWREKSISGYVFSGFLIKKKVKGFRFRDLYRMIWSGPFAKDEEAEIDIGNNICPENLKQGGNTLAFSMTLPPAYGVKFDLSGAAKKIAWDNDACSGKCYRITIRISQLDLKKAEEGQAVSVGGSILSIQTINPGDCK